MFQPFSDFGQPFINTARAHRPINLRPPYSKRAKFIKKQSANLFPSHFILWNEFKSDLLSPLRFNTPEILIISFGSRRNIFVSRRNGVDLRVMFCGFYGRLKLLKLLIEVEHEEARIPHETSLTTSP